MTELHLAVGLDGYGWHPHAWRYAFAHNATGGGQLSGRYWAALAGTAERGLLDFLTIDDSLDAQPGRRAEILPRRLAGRADATLVAARIAPATRHIGLIPVATVTHTEPFHVSKAIATLDYISRGRAGWQIRVSPTAHEAALFGRRTPPTETHCSARPQTPSRWCAGSGTAGRTTPSSAMSRPVATSTATNCITSTSTEVLLGQGALDHPAAASGPAGGDCAGTRRLRIRRAPAPTWSSSPHTTRARYVRSWARSATRSAPPAARS